MVVSAGGYLVLGKNDNSVTNGGVAVDYEYSGITLANGADELVLTDGLANEIDRVEWDGGPAFPDPTGASMSLANDTTYQPEKLPFSTLTFLRNETAIEFNASKRRFDCDILTYECAVLDTLPDDRPFVLWLPMVIASSFVAGFGVIAALVAVTSALAPLLRATPLGFEDIETFRDPGELIGLAIYWSFLLFAWQVFYFGHQLTQRLRNAEVKRWRLEAAVTEAELRALKAQLDPHFIFNSLNGIRALVSEDPPRAREMITRLAGILRFTLRAGDRDTVPLREELETVRNYLALEAVRFEGRLECEFEVAPDTLDVLVPPMVIQHLVENGIKHGVRDRPGPGRLRLVSCRDRGGERLVIEVHNQGRLGAVSGGGAR